MISSPDALEAPNTIGSGVVTNADTPPQDEHEMEFILFPKLATELRLKVWIHAISEFQGPREIDLSFECIPLPRPEEQDIIVWRKIIRDFKKQIRFPNTLFANQESRRETLRVLNFVFPKVYLPKGACPKEACIRHTEGCVFVPVCVDPRADNTYYLPVYRSYFTARMVIIHAPQLLRTVKRLELRGEALYFSGILAHLKEKFVSLESVYIFSKALYNHLLLLGYQPLLNDVKGLTLPDTLTSICVRKPDEPLLAASQFDDMFIRKEIEGQWEEITASS